MVFLKDCKRVKTDGVIWRTQMTALPGNLSFSETWHPRKHLVDLGEPVNLKCQARHPACIPHSTHGFGGARWLKFWDISDHFFVVNHKEPKIMKGIENPRPPGPQTNQVLLELLQDLSCRWDPDWLYLGLNIRDQWQRCKIYDWIQGIVQNVLPYQSTTRHVKNCEDMWRQLKTYQNMSRSFQIYPVSINSWEDIDKLTRFSATVLPLSAAQDKEWRRMKMACLACLSHGKQMAQNRENDWTPIYSSSPCPWRAVGAMKDASFHHIDMYSWSIKPVVRDIFDFECWAIPRPVMETHWYWFVFSFWLLV